MHNTDIYYTTKYSSIHICIHICNLYSIFEINNLLTMKYIHVDIKLVS